MHYLVLLHCFLYVLLINYSNSNFKTWISPAVQRLYLDFWLVDQRLSTDHLKNDFCGQKRADGWVTVKISVRESVTLKWKRSKTYSRFITRHLSLGQLKDKDVPLLIKNNPPVNAAMHSAVLTHKQLGQRQWVSVLFGGAAVENQNRRCNRLEEELNSEYWEYFSTHSFY